MSDAKDKYRDVEERKKLWNRLKKEGDAKGQLKVEIQVDMDDIVQDLWNSMML